MPERWESGLAKPAPDVPRLIAWEAFSQVQKGGEYSHIYLPRLLSESQLDARDRGFVTEIVYGALRMQGHSDFVLAQVSNRTIETLDESLHHFLRFALYQVLHMRTPAHAVVSANVELARKVIGESKASFVNAILRKASSHSLSEWLKPSEDVADPIARLAILHSHPEWIVSAYLDALGSLVEVEEALKANNIPATPTLVAWPGSISQSELAAEGGEATTLSRFGVRANKPPHEFDAVRRRKAGVQDEGSQVVATTFFAALSGAHSLLDTCAGPGGKAALLSRLSQENGITFHAYEISPARAELVKQVVTYGDVSIGDAREITGSYDAIVSDVPCTGIGALRRRPEVRWRRTPEDLKNLLPLQLEIAQRAIANLNPGGTLGYITCSPHLAETRGAIENLLRKNSDLEELRVDTGIQNASSGKAMQLWTHRHNTDAMFLALLRKRATV